MFLAFTHIITIIIQFHHVITHLETSIFGRTSRRRRRVGCGGASHRHSAEDRRSPLTPGMHRERSRDTYFILAIHRSIITQHVRYHPRRGILGLCFCPGGRRPGTRGWASSPCIAWRLTPSCVFSPFFSPGFPRRSSPDFMGSARVVSGRACLPRLRPARATERTCRGGRGDCG